MAKLITPVQYEPAVAGLNEPRPLQLADKVRQGIDIPVLNFTPDGEIRPADGRFARCSQQGVLLKHKETGFENYQQLSRFLDFIDPYTLAIFSQKVYKVITLIYYDTTPGYFRWVGKSPYPVFAELSLTGVTVSNFVGDRIYFSGGGIAGWEIGFNIYGFY